MAKAHSEFVGSCFVISSFWDKCTETERRRFYYEAIARFGADVVRQTVNELVISGKTINVVDYFRDQLSPV